MLVFYLKIAKSNNDFFPLNIKFQFVSPRQVVPRGQKTIAKITQLLMKSSHPFGHKNIFHKKSKIAFLNKVDTCPYLKRKNVSNFRDGFYVT